MASALLGLLFFVLVDEALARKLAAASEFDQNYYITWAPDHISFPGQEIVQLSMDKNNGCGFGSKSYYGSGFFHLNIKVPGGDTAGVITTFYLSAKTNQNHDELDFEFLGNVEGQPYTLQTNIYINGVGGREQRLHLWFDPTIDFHSYKILWNPYQIVFFVDDFPIRVFRNQTDEGVGYPSQAMQILATIWQGDWATGGAKTNWTYAPFIAQYQGFNVDGCPSSPGYCSSADFWWNSERHKNLNATEENSLEYVKNNFLTYDYCSDRTRYPQPPPECTQ